MYGGDGVPVAHCSDDADVVGSEVMYGGGGGVGVWGAREGGGRCGWWGGGVADRGGRGECVGDEGINGCRGGGGGQGADVGGGGKGEMQGNQDMGEGKGAHGLV